VWKERPANNSFKQLCLTINFSNLFSLQGHEVDNTPGLLDSAVDYVKIRAFSMPTSLWLGVMQAALLGSKDSVTPLIAIWYSTVVNVIGDYILVRRCHMGLQGASIATLLAQWAGTVALFRPAKSRLLPNSQDDLPFLLGISRRKNRTTNTNTKRQKTMTDDTVTGRMFLGFAAPVLTLILGKLAAFGFMTHAAGTGNKKESKTGSL
jgi:hypothetical protein